MSLILDYLRTQAEAKKSKALLTLNAFSTRLSAIGDHTTGDLYDNLTEAYTNYIDACDELEHLSKLEEDFDQIRRNKLDRLINKFESDSAADKLDKALKDVTGDSRQPVNDNKEEPDFPEDEG